MALTRQMEVMAQMEEKLRLKKGLQAELDDFVFSHRRKKRG